MAASKWGRWAGATSRRHRVMQITTDADYNAQGRVTAVRGTRALGIRSSRRHVLSSRTEERIVVSRNSRQAVHRALGALGAAVAIALTSASRVAAQDLPSRLADSTFWRLVTDFSEPGGYFRSDNFVSNEMAFQYVIPALQKTTIPGGVYLGVGPDQNFTYIVALRPKLSFIFDIRRGNLEEHLLYKAIIELSENRADFLSRLFSRPRPAGLDTAASADV